MDDATAAAIGAWVTQAGLAGAAEPELIHGFASRLVAAGLPLARVTVIVDTLHPVHEGRVFRWRDDQPQPTPAYAYGRTDQGEQAASWQRSPFFHLLQSGRDALHRRLDADTAKEFDVFADLHAEGQTDYLALAHRFTPEHAIGEMDCILSSWTSEAAEGFGARHAAQLTALAAEAQTRARIAPLDARRRADGLALTELYLGLHIGAVFYGNIGSLERLDFTVIGPAVNEVARIAAMCRSAERDVLISAAFAEAAGSADIVSVGRYALRGVARPQELFTLVRPIAS
jgi:adenylate cyclase